MRRFSVLVATVMATAVISTTPALAAEAHPAVSTTTSAAASGPAVRSAATVPVATAMSSVPAAPEGLPTNWFKDYNACIWGIGLPAGVAWVFVTTPATWPALARLRSIPVGPVAWYVPRVIGACGRFIRS